MGGVLGSVSISPVEVSLLAPLVIMAAAATVCLLSSKKRIDERTLRVFGPDVVTTAFVNHSGMKYRAVVAFIVFSSVAAVLSLGPAIKDGFFLAKPIGILMIFTYTVIAPGVLAGYILLIISVSRLLEKKDLFQIHSGFGTKRDYQSQPLRYGLLFWAYQIIIVAVSLAIVYQVVAFQSEFATPWSPWVGVDWNAIQASLEHRPPGDFGDLGRQQGELTYIGGLYYGLVRGFSVIIGIAGMVAIVVIWWLLTQRLEVKDPKKLLTNLFQIIPEVRAIGAAAIIMIAVSVLGTSLYGVIGYLHASTLDGVEQVHVFTKSTMILWTVLNLLMTVFGFTILYRFHSWLKEARDSLEGELVSPLTDSMIGKGKTTDTDLHDLLNRRWEAWRALESKIRKIPTWPIPQSGKITIGASVLVQIANIAMAALALV